MTKRGRGGAAERGEGVRRLELLQNLLLLKLLLFSIPLPTRSRQHQGGTPRLSDRVAGLARRVKGETAENVLLFQAPVRTPSDALTSPHIHPTTHTTDPLSLETTGPSWTWKTASTPRRPRDAPSHTQSENPREVSSRMIKAVLLGEGGHVHAHTHRDTLFPTRL